MNLKEAFRYQNKLQTLMLQGEDIIANERNVTRVTTTYLRNKVMPEAQNETVVDVADTEYAERITEVVGFLMYLLEQREILSAAIRRAKAQLDIDIDGESSLNSIRQRLANRLRIMGDMRSSEVTVHGGGRGHRFNAEGNQVSYLCDAKRVTTINFDRGRVRGCTVMLSKKADAVSAQLDSCMINSVVDYAPPFDVNDTFAQIFEAYAVSHA